MRGPGEARSDGQGNGGSRVGCEFCGLDTKTGSRARKRGSGHEEREFAVGLLGVFSGRVGRGGLHCGWLGDGAG